MTTVLRPVSFLLRPLLVAATAAMLSACERPGTPLDAHAIERARREAGNVAAEARFLEDERARGDVSEPYARVHREALLEDAGRIGDDLRKPATPDTRPEQEAIEARLQAIARALERTP